jgi:hypothetical protein
VADDMNTLQDIFGRIQHQHEQQESRRLAEIKAQWREFGEIADRDLIYRLCFSSQEFFNSCLAQHPAKKLWDNVGNVNRAFDILRASRSDLIDLAGQLHARITYDLMDDESRNEALSKATKEIYTYSCAASSLVQAYRHLALTSSDVSKKYDDLKVELLSGADAIAFFAELRVANNHLHILVASPHYSVTSNFQSGKREVTSGISFDRDLILSNSEWKARVRQFVASRKNLDVISLMEEHFKLASSFHDLFPARLGIHTDKGFRDIERVLSARKTMSYRTSLAVILQIAVPQKLNPYEYLPRWFSPDELKRIYAFRDGTKEQLEYMIALRDPFGFCDRHTRQELYKLFSVPLETMPEQEEEKPRTDF